MLLERKGLLDERARGGDVDILLVAEDALDMPVDFLGYSRRSTTGPAVVRQAFATGQRLL
ncbi:hypothetical protein SAMN05443662_1511 [Sulfurivirga caldicuralii]|uniref:Uncharacterized protein n=1 Tax=Sulfurivirga caldicuralii TaxID=364032 RepID=A0A1N6GUX6_9GAMM|nr:hypothetical protein [Sulfurivirga caldicuralii]SIO11391.1 hypothetical protein SAMN05443662_1511 [Sulfurivirga caldicuralii]